MADAHDFKLIIEDDLGHRSIVTLNASEIAEMGIGRAPASAIRLDERNISRRHAKLSHNATGGLTVEDLDSYNGVWVNGNRVEKRHDLTLGDMLRIGDFNIEISDAQGQSRDEPTQRLLAINTEENTHPQSSPLRRIISEEITLPTSDMHDVVAAHQAQAASDALSSNGALKDHSEATALINVNKATETASLGKPAANVRLQPPFATLLCTQGPIVGQAFELNVPSMTLGRTPENHICIDHRSISRQHIKLLVEPNRVRLVDMGSANGTLVNNEPYQQTELKPGDDIELGHVHFRFFAPGQRPALSQAEQARQQIRAENTHPGFTPFILASRHKLPWALATAGLVIFLVGTLLWFATAGKKTSGTIDTDVVSQAQNVTAAHAQEGATDEVNHLLQQAHQAAGVRQYKRAEALASAVLAMDPQKTEAQDILHQSDVEQKGKAAIDLANSAIAASSWADAFNALQDVPKDSSYAQKAQGLLAQVKPPLIHDRLVDCRHALDGQDYDEAELLIEEIEGLDFNQPELKVLRQAAEEGRRHHQTNAITHATHRLKAQDAQKSSKNQAVKEPHPQFAATDDAPKLYTEATRLLGGNQTQKAVEMLTRCVAADKNFAMCYRALGIAYAKLGNGAKAVRYYRSYLRVEPQARDAAQVRQLIAQYETEKAVGHVDEHAQGDAASSGAAP